MEQQRILDLLGEMSLDEKINQLLVFQREKRV